EDAVPHVVGEDPEVRVAGRKLRPGVADADHRAAVELVVRHAAVLGPAAVDEAVDVLTTEPLNASQILGFSRWHGRPKYRKHRRWKRSNPRTPASRRARRSRRPRRSAPSGSWRACNRSDASSSG